MLIGIKIGMSRIATLTATCGWPFVIHKPDSVERALRSAVLYRWSRIPGPALKLLMFFGWPLRSLWQAFEAPNEINRLLGFFERLRLVATAWKKSLYYSIAPIEYLTFTQGQRCEQYSPRRWLYAFEYGCLARRITSCSTKGLLDDKAAFGEFCRKRNLACVETVGLVRVETHLLLPKQSIVVKPITSSGSKGVEVYHFDGGTFRRGEIVRRIDELEQDLSYRGKHGEKLIVQPKVEIHPSLIPVARGDGAPTIRVITIRWPSEVTEIVAAFVVSSAHGGAGLTGGAFRLIDTTSGRALPAAPIQIGRLKGTFRDDPDFNSIEVPFWDEVRLLVLTAHRLLPGQAPVIGWDVFVAPDGPLLCEGNVSISFYEIQAATGIPMLDTNVGRLLPAYLT